MALELSNERKNLLDQKIKLLVERKTRQTPKLTLVITFFFSARMFLGNLIT